MPAAGSETVQRILMGVRAGLEDTRVLVHEGPKRPILKARLPPVPVHDRAMIALCEGLALWCGRPVHVALDAAEPERFCGMNPWLSSADGVVRTALFELQVAQEEGRVRRPELTGLGDFRDLRKLVLFEACE